MASTSFAFMLVLVPEPVWNTSIGNWSSCTPLRTTLHGVSNRVGDASVEQTEVDVHPRSGAFDLADRMNEPRRHRHARDREVLDGALGLRRVQRIRGHLHFAHAVAFDARLLLWPLQAPLRCRAPNLDQRRGEEQPWQKSTIRVRQVIRLRCAIRDPLGNLTRKTRRRSQKRLRLTSHRTGSRR